MWEDKEKMQSNDSSAHVTRFCEYKKKFPIKYMCCILFLRVIVAEQIQIKHTGKHATTLAFQSVAVCII